LLLLREDLWKLAQTPFHPILSRDVTLINHLLQVQMPLISLHRSLNQFLGDTQSLTVKRVKEHLPTRRGLFLRHGRQILQKLNFVPSILLSLLPLSCPENKEEGEEDDEEEEEKEEEEEDLKATAIEDGDDEEEEEEEEDDDKAEEEREADGEHAS
jgi:Ran GTPase-activating protein (RanGAP) involved in mRNA processing and transport